MAALLDPNADPGSAIGYGTSTNGQLIPLNKYGLSAGSSPDELIAAMKSDNTLQSVTLPGVTTTPGGLVVWQANPSNTKPQSYYLTQGISVYAANLSTGDPTGLGGAAAAGASAVGAIFSKVGTTAHDAATGAANAAGDAAKKALPWATIAAVGILSGVVIIVSDKL